LGFRDVIELTGLIVSRRKLGLPVSSALAEYERVRKLDNGMMIFATDTLNRLFSNNFTPLRIARDLGLGIVNEIPLLKRFFMKAASGRK
jgi:2-octaprenyl-6-methoxyphenol hydroxylase